MSSAIFSKFFFLLLGVGILMPSLQAQQPRTISAQQAVNQIQGRFGMDSAKWVSEIRGSGGQPQPIQWDIVTHDAKASGLLHHFRASAGIVQDGGPDARRYPNDLPNGFFSMRDVAVDSVAAFAIAEAEARKARMGFDSCDYFLQLRAFTRETVWKLDLIDASHRLVGAIYISGINGQVLRTVWVKRDTVSGYPQMIDSSSPTSPKFTQGSGAQPSNQGIVAVSPVNSGIGNADPYASVSPNGAVRPTPQPAPRGSIFREFPSQGGGGGSPAPNVIFGQSNNPLDPTPAVPPTPAVAQTPIPGPEILQQVPLDPTPPVAPRPVVPKGPRPPISVPSGGVGSSARISPPPVPPSAN